MEDEIIKAPDFKNIVDVLNYYDLNFSKTEFIDFSKIESLELDNKFIKDLNFALGNVGLDDKEFFMSEFIIVPFLREIWQQHLKLDLFSHVPLKINDFTVIPDYLISKKNKRGLKVVDKPL